MGCSASLGACQYRLGEHSIISVPGKSETPQAIMIIMKSAAQTRAQAQIVMSSILVLTEIAAPEESETQRVETVQQLLRSVEAVRGAPMGVPKGVCQTLGGHWEYGGQSGQWEIGAHEYGGQLEIQIRRPGSCPQRG
jgi:hypothetical protein